MKQTNLLDRFETYLAENNFRAGDKLPSEMELAEYFQTSRGTIREIIIHLTLLGVLARQSKVGTVIAAPEAGTIGRSLAMQLRFLGSGREELKATRLLLESAAAPEIVRCMTPKVLDQLGRLLDEMAGCDGNPERADEIDLEFHLQLFEVTGNRLLQIFSQVLGLLFNPKYRTAFRTPEAIQKSVASHRAMLKAIAAREEETLRNLISEHIRPL